MIAALDFVPYLFWIVWVIVLAVVAWKVSTGLHQLHNAKIAPQPPDRLAELRARGRSNLAMAAVGFVALIVIGLVNLYAPTLIDWFAA